MLKRCLISPLFNFAKKKEITVKNYIKQTPIASYKSYNDSEVEKFLYDAKVNKGKWIELATEEREQILKKYYEELTS